MYQFIHIETYARKASTKVKPSKPKNEKQAAAAAARSARSADAGGGAKGMDAYVGTIQTPKTRANVSDVVGEALRDSEHCPHVEKPEPPTFLVGDEATLRGLPDEIERNLAAYHAKNGGRKVRSDTHVLLAGVASYPRELEQTDPAAYDKWEKSTVKWLQEKYGDNLRCVIRHDDEAHPHIHFYVCDRELVNAKELHDGYKGAAAAIAEHGQLSKQAKAAFNDCMRDFQSDYYAKVGHAAGLQRDGPKRLRLDGATYKAREREARERVALDAEVSQVHSDMLDGAAIQVKKSSDMHKAAEREKKAMVIAMGDMDFDRQEFIHAHLGLVSEQAALVELRADIHREASSLDEAWAKARDFRAALDARHETFTKRETACANREMVVGLKETHASETMKAAKHEHGVADEKWDRATKEIKEAQRLGAFYLNAHKQLLGVDDVARIAARPELEGMVKLLAESQDARDLVFLMQRDPSMVTYIRTSMALTSASQEHSIHSEVDWSAVLNAADEATAARSKDSGLNLS